MIVLTAGLLAAILLLPGAAGAAARVYTDPVDGTMSIASTITDHDRLEMLPVYRAFLSFGKLRDGTPVGSGVCIISLFSERDGPAARLQLVAGGKVRDILIVNQPADPGTVTFGFSAGDIVRHLSPGGSMVLRIHLAGGTIIDWQVHREIMDEWRELAQQARTLKMLPPAERKPPRGAKVPERSI